MPSPQPRKIALGFDNYSIRALGWKAPRLLDYAASLKLDMVLFSDLGVYERLDDAYLKDIRLKAADLGLSIHAGTGGICPSSHLYPADAEPAEDHLRRTIRVARALGSPVARCYLGIWKDRETEGGIAVHIRNTVRVLKAVRGEARDAGVRIAVENHAGDMQARELVALVEEAGRDFVGVTADSGNAVWTFDHPLLSLEILAPYVVTTGLRDSMLWETADGVEMQWTAMGDGLVDWKAYFARFAELCPGVPAVLEIIPGLRRAFPHRRDGFWKAWPQARQEEVEQLLALAPRGRPLAVGYPPGGDPMGEAGALLQKTELERSVRYCKESLGLGMRDG